MFMINVDVTAM